MGAESQRGLTAPERTIYINLDHPQIEAAGEVQAQSKSPTFKRLSYQVAFSEYSIALAQEMVAHGEFYDLTDPIVEIRDTLNPIAVRQLCCIVSAVCRARASMRKRRHRSDHNRRLNLNSVLLCH